MPSYNIKITNKKLEEQLSKHSFQTTQKGKKIKKTIFFFLKKKKKKRTDIWSVYCDMEIKYGSLQSARNLFDRIITMQFKAKQMKFFFKKYLQFEASKGNSERLDYVK